MDGYIKKSEAVDVIVKYPYRLAGKTATAIKMIEDLPSADVVEIVRCKDCVWWEVHRYGGLYGKCENPTNGLRQDYVGDDDFCSYGKRRE